MQSILRNDSSPNSSWKEKERHNVSFLHYNEAEEYNRHLSGLKHREKWKEKRRKKKKLRKASFVYNSLLDPANTSALKYILEEDNEMRIYFSALFQQLRFLNEQLLGDLISRIPLVPLEDTLIPTLPILKNLDTLIQANIPYTTLHKDELLECILASFNKLPQFTNAIVNNCRFLDMEYNAQSNAEEPFRGALQVSNGCL